MATIESVSIPAWTGSKEWTIWGKADQQRVWGDGIAEYCTASHGGFKIDKALISRVWEVFPTLQGQFNDGCFEEDCDYVFVVLAFPNLFPIEMRERAERSRSMWNPEHSKAA